MVAYKALAMVKRAFRTIKSELAIRPVYVYTEAHVRGHVFLCMLAYYLEWHMRMKLAPLLFQDADREGAQEEKGLPVHSFQTLLDDLATLVLNTVQLPTDKGSMTMATQPTALQSKAFELLEVRLN